MKRITALGSALTLALGFAVALTGNAAAQIKFGVAGPLTGSNAAFGAQLKNGFEQAVEDINAAGGIQGQKITTVVGDDVGDPKQGVSVANKFVVRGREVRGRSLQFRRHHAGVRGLPGKRHPLDHAGLDQSARDRAQYVERVPHLRPRRPAGRGGAALYPQAMKGKKIAVVHDKTTYGQGLADETRKAMNKGGIKEVLYEGINLGDKDFAALVSKIKASGADMVYWGGLHTEGGLLVRQMRDQGVKAVLFGADGITSDEFASIGGPGVEGTLMTFAPDPRKRPEAKGVIEKFRAKKFEPEAYTLYSYAAVEVMKQAADAAKSLDPKKVAAQIKSGKKFKTVIGEMSFDKKGDITRPDYVVYVWKKGADGKITYTE